MRHNDIIITGVIFFLLMCERALFGQKKVSYDGYLEIGEQVKYRNIYVESFYRVKLEYKLKINDNTKIEIDIRANSENRQLELHEGSASFNLSKRLEFEIGDLRKRYGLEEQTSREKLSFINKSMINEYLEPLGFVSRDPGLQLKWEDAEENIALTGGIHYNESHRYTIFVLAERRDMLGLDNIGATFQLARERDNDLSHTYIANVNAKKDFGFIDWELEFFSGQDPIESYYRNLNGDEGLVTFFGAKSLMLRKFYINSKFIEAIEPLFLGGLLVKDTEQFDVNSIQLLIGLNIYFDEDIRFMINGNLILSNHEYDKRERTLHGSDATAQLQIRW